MQWLAGDAQFLLEAIPGGGGSNSFLDTLGMARGRLICATAAVWLSEAFGGARPSKNNELTAEVCSLVWRAAGCASSDAVETGDVDTLACWERHLRKALGQGEDKTDSALMHAQMIVGQVMIDSGLRDAISGTIPE